MVTNPTTCPGHRPNTHIFYMTVLPERTAGLERRCGQLSRGFVDGYCLIDWATGMSDFSIFPFETGQSVSGPKAAAQL